MRSVSTKQTPIPLISHQGEIQSEGIASHNDIDGFGFQIEGAYGATNHFMIQALTSYQLASNDIMAAGGWYNTYNNGAVLELLGGYEWQHMTYRDTYLFGGLPEKDDGRNHMVFGRIDFGWPALRLGGKNSPWIANAGISTRLGHLYSNIHIEDYRNEKETTTTDYTANGLMLEPQLQLGIGWKMIQLNLRASLSMRFNLDDAPFNYMPYTLGLGIQVRL